MFETLFKRPSILARYLNDPWIDSKIKFLEHCAKQGFSHSELRKYAWVLLVFSQSIDLNKPGLITQKQIEYAIKHRIHYNPSTTTDSRSTQLFYIHIATEWLRFYNRLAENKRCPSTVFDVYLEKFIAFMRDERGLSKFTIQFHYEILTKFFVFVARKKVLIKDLSIHDVDAYITYQGNHGWARKSLHRLAGCLRNFFHYAEIQGWVKGIADIIDVPRVYAQENLPIGPTWEEVKQLIKSFSSNSPSDLRARAIVLLLSVYGLRRGEVAVLCLENIDWISEILHVIRPKIRHTQQYPLDKIVGDAILNYIKRARPYCSYRQLFLTLNAPIRPLSPASISAIIRSRLRTLKINISKTGAHCLRHACAQHLLAEGFSLKQIGDQLGHSNLSTTQIYAKVDFKGLRQVAELDLRELL